MTHEMIFFLVSFCEIHHHHIQENNWQYEAITIAVLLSTFTLDQQVSSFCFAMANHGYHVHKVMQETKSIMRRPIGFPKLFSQSRIQTDYIVL